MLSILWFSAVRSVILAVIVWVAFVLFRVRHPAVKKAGWAGVLAVAFAMPFLSGRLLHFGLWGSDSSSTGQTSMVLVQSPSHRANRDGGEGPSRGDLVPVLPGLIPAHPSPVRTEFVLDAAYGLVVALLLLRLALGYGRARGIWQRAEPFEDRVKVSAEIASPSNFGSGVLLPAEASQWSPEILSLVLAHERMHVRQRDFYLQLAVQLYTALFWFSPLGWWLRRECMTLAEQTSDHAALQAVPDPATYAELLVRFSSARSSAAFVGMARASRLRSRIDLLFAGVGADGEAGAELARYFAAPLRSAAFTASALLVAILLATVSLTARQAPAQSTLGARSGGPPPSMRRGSGIFGPVSVHLRAGDRAPDFAYTKVLHAAEATSWTSDSLTGKTTVFVFYPLVSPNSDAIAQWNSTVARFQDKPLQFVLMTSEDESTLLPWLAKHPMNGWVFYDPGANTARAYGFEIPATTYIGPDRRIIAFDRSLSVDDQTLNAVLDGRITTTRPPPTIAGQKAFFESGKVLLQADSPRMSHPDDHRPNFPPSETLHISPAAAELGTSSLSSDDYWVRQGFDLKSVLGELYGVDPIRISLPASLDSGKRYDFAMVLPHAESEEWMHSLIERQLQEHFGISLVRENRLSDVYVITAPAGIPQRLATREDPDSMGGSSSSGVELETTGNPEDRFQAHHKRLDLSAVRGISLDNGTMDDFCRVLESSVDRPVVDETQVKGRFDIRISSQIIEQNNFQARLRKETGLEVTPARRTVEMLVFKTP